MDFNNIGFAINWLMFLGLFLMAFIWLRRAYRIFKKKDYSEVALKGGEPPENAEKWAPLTGSINLAAGSVALFTIIGIFAALLSYDTWTTTAQITLLMKIFADFIVSRQAHPFKTGRNKKATEEK